MKFFEINLFGVYVAPMSLLMVAAWFATVALRRVAGRYYEFRGRSMDIHIDADATCWVSSDSSVSVFTRRRSRSYICAFSIAPEASEAMCIISFRVSSPNSCGAWVCNTITPIVSPARDKIGTAAID